MKEALFFCSAVADILPEYNEAARAIVRGVCNAGYGVVSGGTIKGTMKVVCDTAKECGAHNRGVVPRFMAGLEYPDLDVLEWTDSMSERKDRMRAGTSLAIALPGGIGTLDELAETFCLAKMGLYEGRVVVYNHSGFYDNLRDMFRKFVETNMLPEETMDKIFFPSSVEELLELL